MANTGKTWVIWVVVIAVIALLSIGIFTWYIHGYNKAVNLNEATQTAWANVDAVLQRRLDLIPNLVETVKGYASHEKDLFENIAKSREKYFQAKTIPAKIEASNELGAFLSKLMMLQESYPNLKANQNFLTLQDQLEGTENRIAVSRVRYNETAKLLNSYTKQFFGSFFCKQTQVVQVDYFEASEEAKTQVPGMKFK